MYKFLQLSSEGQIRSEAGECTWMLGEWQSIQGEPVLCERGFHCSARILDAFLCVKGTIVAEVETDGLCDLGADKQAWQRMRLLRAWHWCREDSVMLAIEAASRVLHLYEHCYPRDGRPRAAIEAAARALAHPAAALDALADASVAVDDAARDAADADARSARAAAWAAFWAAAAADNAAWAAYAAGDDVAAVRAAAAVDNAAWAAWADAGGVMAELNTWMQAHLQALEPVHTGGQESFMHGSGPGAASK